MPWEGGRGDANSQHCCLRRCRRWHREQTGEVAYEQRFFLDGEEPEDRLRREAAELEG